MGYMYVYYYIIVFHTWSVWTTTALLLLCADFESNDFLPVDPVYIDSQCIDTVWTPGSCNKDEPSTTGEPFPNLLSFNRVSEEDIVHFVVAWQHLRVACWPTRDLR